MTEEDADACEFWFSVGFTLLLFVGVVMTAGAVVLGAAL